MLIIYLKQGLYEIGGFLLSLWWIYLPILLAFLAKGLWIKKARQQFVNQMNWVILEIKPPAEIKKTPRVMEQFFASLHGTQRTPNWKERNIGGEVQEWFSLETISQGGQIHYLIRTLAHYRNLIEAQIYAQYPEAEIEEVDDYTQSISDNLLDEGYDLWGTELVLVKEDAYPILTYPDFEKNIMMEEQRLDPLASLLEVMSKIEEGEHIWIQTLIRPVMDEWKKTGEELRDKLMKRIVEKKEGILKKEFTAWKELTKEEVERMITGQAGEGGGLEKKDDKRWETFLNPPTQREKDVITAIEDNISKIGYETIIRFVYLARREVFRKPNVAAVIGCYKQFNTQHLNGFKPNKKLTTKIDYKVQLKKPREIYRKKEILSRYKRRDFILQSKVISYLKTFFFEELPILNWFFIKSQPFVLNIEELATVYHYPGLMVKAPQAPKVEAKRGQPPSGLPTDYGN